MQESAQSIVNRLEEKIETYYFLVEELKELTTAFNFTVPASLFEAVERYFTDTYNSLLDTQYTIDFDSYDWCESVLWDSQEEYIRVKRAWLNG